MTFLRKHGLEDYVNSPRLAFIVVCCCSLFNDFHPGFTISFMSEDEQRLLGNHFMNRLPLENPLLYDGVFTGINFTSAAQVPGPRRRTQPDPRRVWVQTDVAALQTNDPINFPRIARNQINPHAVELTGGIHGLFKANSC